MEQGYGPEYQIQKEIKKSRTIIILSTVMLFIVFSYLVVQVMMNYGKEEFALTNKNVDSVGMKVDSVYNKEFEIQVSVNEVAKMLDESLKNDELILNSISNVNTKVNKANNNLDSIIVYTKK
jgi:hypothetical protein